MENLEIREDRKPRRDQERGRGRRENARKDKFRPEKYHDHVAAMEPAPTLQSDAPSVARANPVVQAVEPVVSRPAKGPKPSRDQRRPQHKKREPEHRASHDRKNDATPVKPEKHQLPAFLFRPVPRPKKVDAEG